MSHFSRPVPAKRIFASYGPVRESDGDEWYVGRMVDTRELRIHDARQDVHRSLERARAARAAGDGSEWARWMGRAAYSRHRLGGLKRSGGRVDWRGEPVQEVSRG